MTITRSRSVAGECWEVGVTVGVAAIPMAEMAMAMAMAMAMETTLPIKTHSRDDRVEQNDARQMRVRQSPCINPTVK